MIDPFADVRERLGASIPQYTDPVAVLALRNLLADADALLAVVDAAKVGIDDILDALQSQDYSDEINIVTAAGLCREAEINMLAALPERLKEILAKGDKK